VGRIAGCEGRSASAPVRPLVDGFAAVERGAAGASASRLDGSPALPATRDPLLKAYGVPAGRGSGNRRVTAVPFRASLSIEISPPRSSMARLQMASPSPVPLFVEK
jgi:hypothetical protein